MDRVLAYSCGHGGAAGYPKPNPKPAPAPARLVGRASLRRTAATLFGILSHPIVSLQPTTGLWQPPLPVVVCFPLGLWLMAVILVGNPTLVVSDCVYMYQHTSSLPPSPISVLCRSGPGRRHGSNPVRHSIRPFLGGHHCNEEPPSEQHLRPQQHQQRHSSSSSRSGRGGHRQQLCRGGSWADWGERGHNQ
jgi:hypothetical protein